MYDLLEISNRQAVIKQAEMIKTALSKKGYIFESELELHDFAREHLEMVHLHDGTTKLCLDGETILYWNDFMDLINFSYSRTYHFV